MTFVPETSNRTDWPRIVSQVLNRATNAIAGILTRLGLVETDVAVVEGDVAANAAFLATVSQFASVSGGFITGQYYDSSPHGVATNTLAGVADRFDLTPFYAHTDIAIDQIGALVTTGVALAEFKVVIYNSDADGWPDELLHETAGIAAATSSAYANASITFTFQRGVKYWIGWRQSSTATFATLALTSAFNLGMSTATSTTYYTILRRSLTYATAAPDPFVFTAADLQSNRTPPSIRFRVA